MRTLKFTVEATELKHDPNGNFDGLFPAKDQQMMAEFSFSAEWKSAVKVVAFYSILGKEYPPQVVNEANVCKIPEEALSLPVFRMQVFGNIRGIPLSTNILSIYQKGGNL